MTTVPANVYQNPGELSKLASRGFGLIKEAESAAVRVITGVFTGGVPVADAAAGVLHSTGEAVQEVASAAKETATSAGQGIKKGFTIVTVIVVGFVALYLWRMIRKPGGA